MSGSTGEIRRDRVTGRWVIFAPERGERPKEVTRGLEEPTALPAHDPNCPFCPGNEDQLTPILLETPGSGDLPWQTRVVPNKYPALSTRGSTNRRVEGPYLKMPGFGRHEVIIEHPRHDYDLPDMSIEAVAAVIDTYHRRYVQVMAEHDNMLALIFRNHGPHAGTSLWHPHSQLLVTGVVPRKIRQREEAAQHYYDTWGRCVYCDILTFEMQDRSRLVLGEDEFLAFVPFAAEVPYEVWLLPRRHCADFGATSGAERRALAHALREVLRRLDEQLGQPDYNMVINTAARYQADEPHLHWYMRVRPRLTTPAGFEIGSGMMINPSSPEEDAATLRQG